jgi:hypothetical protein
MMGGPQGGIPPKTVGDILSAALNIYKANASQLILVVAVVVVPLSLIAALFSGVVFAPERIRVTNTGGVVAIDYAGRGLGVFLLVGAVGALIAVLTSAILQAAILRAATQATIGDPVDVETSYRYGLKRLWSVILVSLLVGLIVAVGFVLLVIPGIIFLVFLSLSIPVLIVEGRRGTEAMARSWNLVKGHFWHALGVIVIAAFIVGIISGVIGADRRRQLGRAMDLHRHRTDPDGSVRVARLGPSLPGPPRAERGAVPGDPAAGAGFGHLTFGKRVMLDLLGTERPFEASGAGARAAAIGWSRLRSAACSRSSLWLCEMGSCPPRSSCGPRSSGSSG